MPKPCVLVTQTQPGADQFAEMLRSHGYEPLIQPVLTIRQLPVHHKLSDIDAIAITSRHALAFLQLHANDKNILLFTVGESTAHAARELGFTNVIAAKSDALSLARLIKEKMPQNAHILYARGQDISFNLKAYLEPMNIYEVICYAAEPLAQLPDELISALQTGHIGIITFFSARAAEFFVRALNASSVQFTSALIDCFCLSGQIARAAEGAAWRSLTICPAPDQKAMLESIDNFTASH